MRDESRPRLHIETLALTLPAGYETRARRIGRLTAEILASRLAPLPDGRLTHLTLSPVTLGGGWSDRRIADTLAGAIAAGMTAATGAPQC